MRICAFGSVNIDLSVSLDRLPASGETRFGHALHIGLGGKGANQAAAAARLGADAALVGRVGDDAFGAQARRLLAGHGLGSTAVFATAGTPTGVALIHVDASGENAITVVSGANAAVTAADFDAAVAAAGLPRLLLLQREIPVAAMLHAAGRVRAAGGLVLFDPAPPGALDELAPLVALADIVLPNAHEAQALTGIRPVDGDSAADAARRLLALGARACIVKCGGQGAWLLDRAGPPRHVPAFPVAVVDSVAAGDCFAGALAVALAEDAPLAEAARFAAAAAAIAVGRKGAAESMPGRAEVEALLRRA